MKRKPISIQGKQYKSLTAAADAFGLSIGMVSRRMKAGWSIEQAVNLSPAPERKATTNKSITVSGQEFESIKEAALYYRVDVKNVRARLALGWKPEEALELVDRLNIRKPSSHHRTIKCEEHTFPSIGKLAEHYGLPYKLVYKRIRLNWSPEQAVGVEPAPPRYRNKDGSPRDHSWVKPAMLKNGQKFPDSADGNYYLYIIENTVNDKVYIGITVTSLASRFLAHKAAASNGEGKQRGLYNAMRKYGSENFSIRLLRNDAKSIQELLDQEVDAIESYNAKSNGYNTAYGGSIGTSHPIEVDNQRFYSMGQAAEYYGIEPSKFAQRVTKLGWSPEEAAELVERKSYGRRNIIYNVTKDGNQYSFPSIASAAAHFKLLPSTVSNRINNGWTLEEALGLVPKDVGRKHTKRSGYDFGGVHYKSLSSLSKHEGISTQALTRYLRETELSLSDAVFILKNSLGTRMQAAMVANKCDHKTALSILKNELEHP